MPLRKPTDETNPTEVALAEIQRALEAGEVPPEAYHYEAELKVEVVRRIQAEADKVLNQEEWVVIDGVDKR